MTPRETLYWLILAISVAGIAISGVYQDRAKQEAQIRQYNHQQQAMRAYDDERYQQIIARLGEQQRLMLENRRLLLELIAQN